MASINSRIQPTTAPPAAKAPAAPAPTPASAAPPAPVFPTDGTLTAPPQGIAATDVALFTPADSEPAIKAWNAAAADPKVDLSAADPKSKIGKLLALRDSVPKGNYTPQQKQRFTDFVQQMMNLAPHIDPTSRMKTLQLINDRLENQGISKGQLDLILDGKFKARDMWFMMSDIDVA